MYDFWFDLEFNSPVKTIKASQSASLFLGRISPLSGSSPETDNYLSWFSRRERMNAGNIFNDLSPWKNVARLVGIIPATSWSMAECASNWATEAASASMKWIYSELSSWEDTYSYWCKISTHMIVISSWCKTLISINTGLCNEWTNRQTHEQHNYYIAIAYFKVGV